MSSANANPYRSPSAPSPLRRSGLSIRSLIWGAVFAYPLLVVSAVYISWALSFITLGRPPVPYRDYPRNVAIDLFAYGGAFLILAGPIAIPAGLMAAYRYPLAQFSQKHTTHQRRIGSVVLYVLLLAAAWALLYFDPWRVLDWYFD